MAKPAPQLRQPLAPSLDKCHIPAPPSSEIAVPHVAQNTRKHVDATTALPEPVDRLVPLPQRKPTPGLTDSGAYGP